MHLRALHLHNFRVYEDALFTFTPKINVIRGPNAIGKTSLLEAIYFLMTGRSFRTSQTNDLIRQGTNYFRLDSIFIKNGLEQKLCIYYEGKDRKIIHNATAYNSFVGLLGLLQGAIVHPDDATIVKGAPSHRRHLLDLQLAQVDPLYVHHLTRYERAMRQRNHMLRAKNTNGIDSWEYEMANAAAYVIQQRAHLVQDLQNQGEHIYHQICGGSETLSLKYKAHGIGDSSPLDNSDLRNLFSSQYQRHRPREMDLGATLTGPHRDDMMISLGGKEARTFASEGQQRSCVMALKLAEWTRLKHISNDIPIMLVDDIAMSLDDVRKSKLIESFRNLDQVFVTTTDQTQFATNENVVKLQVHH